MKLTSSSLNIEVDEEAGVLTELTDPREGTRASYLALEPAKYRSELGVEHLRVGDVVFRIWRDGRWALESTARSGDARTVSLDQEGKRCYVDYDVDSLNPGGLKALGLHQVFEVTGPTLEWRAQVVNRSDEAVEIGELSFPLPLNNDLSSLFGGHPMEERSAGDLQRCWHEERVLGHLHIAGHSSYALVHRPSGVGRVLAIVPTADTSVEVAYQIDPSIASQWSKVFEGPYFLSVHSRAAREVNGWLANRQRQSRSFLGASSRVLAPGAVYDLGFRATFLDDAEDLRAALLGAGQVHIEAVPGYVVPLGHEVRVAVSSATAPRLRAVADGTSIGDAPSGEKDRYLYTIGFATPGQKVVEVHYGGGRRTSVAFFVTPGPRELIEARSSFIVERQLYDNPDDPFRRHHAFLPYDDDVQSPYLDSEEAWQVGGSDEYGLPIAMFLAEKNVLMPVPQEVAALESYVEDWVLKELQDPGSLDIRRGLYYVGDFPSRRAFEWTVEQAHDVRRFNNYPLLANIYHSLARVADRYGMTARRSGSAYLALAWRTAVRGFEVGIMANIGAPAGANLFDLLRYCEDRDPEGYRALEPHLRRFADVSAADPYPYGSELYVDQTAHAQVYAALEHYSYDEALSRCVSALKALRWGFQPSWFRYGNELRGSVCCWYGTPQNSEVMLRAYERYGDARLLKLSMAGLASFLTSVRGDGAAHGWFTWWPDRWGFDTRSLDTDLGLYAYLRAASAYVVEDPVFGIVGYGCKAAVDDDGSVSVVPDNGVNNRVHVAPGFAVVADVPLARVSVSRRRERVEIDARPVGAAADAQVTVRGLPSDAQNVKSNAQVSWGKNGQHDLVLRFRAEAVAAEDGVRIEVLVR